MVDYIVLTIDGVQRENSLKQAKKKRMEKSLKEETSNFMVVLNKHQSI